MSQLRVLRRRVALAAANGLLTFAMVAVVALVVRAEVDQAPVGILDEGALLLPPPPPFLHGKLWHLWPEIHDSARRADVDPIAWAAILAQETSGNPSAIGQAGELGLSQYLPATARKLESQTGLPCFSNWSSPETNLRCGARWLKRVTRQFESGDAADCANLLGMMAYHAGTLSYRARELALGGQDPCLAGETGYCARWRDAVESARRSR